MLICCSLTFLSNEKWEEKDNEKKKVERKVSKGWRKIDYD